MVVCLFYWFVSFHGAHDCVEASETVLELSGALDAQHPIVESGPGLGEVELDTVQQHKSRHETDVRYRHVRPTQKRTHLQMVVHVIQGYLQRRPTFKNVLLKTSRDLRVC